MLNLGCKLFFQFWGGVDQWFICMYASFPFPTMVVKVRRMDLESMLICLKLNIQKALQKLCVGDNIIQIILNRSIILKLFEFGYQVGPW